MKPTTFVLAALVLAACGEATAPRADLLFKQVSAGYSHTCGVTTSGAAYCWGDGFNGKLGNGSTTGTSSPVAVAGGLTFTAVSAGSEYTCGLTTGGAAYCWGSNSIGQLGDGSTRNASTPVAVAGGLTFSAVSTGGAHACGLTTGGAAYCWGGNYYGELGNGSTLDTGTSPMAVAGGLIFSAVSAGADHTCGLTAGGAAYCWGLNVHGQLGNGTADSVPHSMPVTVAGGLTFAAVSAGADHTCSLTAGGTAYCWGVNVYGQLGSGTVDSVPHATPVAVASGLTFAAVSAGPDHTCGVTTGGAAYCWGPNVEGELGDGTTTGAQECVVLAGWGAVRGRVCSATPVAVAGGLTFVVVSAGYKYSCGATAGNTAYCWGANSVGELGNGASPNGELTPVRVVGP